MQVYTKISDLPLFKNAVITIGTFDGVHLGHHQILKQLVNEAEKINGTAVVITFYPHPRAVIEQNRSKVFLLNTPEEKYSLLHKYGIKHIVVVPFSKEFAEQPAAEYISGFLVKKFQPHTIIIGYDHRFGSGREGDYKLLESLSGQYGYKVKEIPQHVLQNIAISSTRIREALLKGDIDTATELLGYSYSLSGIVAEGKKIGRTIGYPTANIEVDDPSKLVPAAGIYAAEIKTENNSESFIGMMSIGTNPTVGGIRQTIEVNIFNFNADIYGKRIEIKFIKWLRHEVKFNGLEELKEALAQDKKDTLKIFGY